jgi:hypothetical protein
MLSSGYSEDFDEQNEGMDFDEDTETMESDMSDFDHLGIKDLEENAQVIVPGCMIGMLDAYSYALLQPTLMREHENPVIQIQQKF